MQQQSCLRTFSYKDAEFAFDADSLRFASSGTRAEVPLASRAQAALDQPTTDATSERGINFITLNIAHDCNMACPYCFAKQGLYGGPRKLMDAATAQRAVDWLIEQSGKKTDCYLRFLGGEPFMNLPIMESTIKYALERGAACGKTIHFSVNTNGTIFSDTISRLIRDHSIIVSISMDGTKEAHNVHRIFKSGQGTYDVVARNLARFLECDPQVMINCTITADNVDVFAYASLFREFGIGSMRFAIVGDPNHKVAVRAQPLLKRICDNYDQLAESYRRDLAAGNVWYLADFYKYFDNLRYLKRRHNRCGAGTTYVNVDVDGHVHLCHRFTADDNQQIGTIAAEALRPPAGIAQMNQLLPIMPSVPSRGLTQPESATALTSEELQFVHRRLDGAPMATNGGNKSEIASNLCSSCDIRYLCGGACFHDGQMLHGDLHGGPDPFKCEVDRHLAKISMWLLDYLSDRPAALARLDELHYRSIQHTN